MELASAVILVVAATVFFTLFVRAKDIPQPEPVSPVKHLDDRKAAIYENLRDLQFEYRVGKLSDEDYQSTKLGLQKELAAVIGEIEKVMKAPAGAAFTPAKPAVKSAPKKAQSEQAPSKGRSILRVAAAFSVDAVSEPAEAKQPEYTCPHCGAKFQKTMKFCGECGKAMA
jgi:hypothetical protein